VLESGIYEGAESTPQARSHVNGLAARVNSCPSLSTPTFELFRSLAGDADLAFHPCARTRKDGATAFLPGPAVGAGLRPTGRTRASVPYVSEDSAGRVSPGEDGGRTRVSAPHDRAVYSAQRHHLYCRSSSGSNSAVECDLAKVEVAGSNPVSRSRFDRSPAPARAFRFSARSGAVAKW
jgi:hypothetical protein